MTTVYHALVSSGPPKCPHCGQKVKRRWSILSSFERREDALAFIRPTNSYVGTNPGYMVCTNSRSGVDDIYTPDGKRCGYWWDVVEAGSQDTLADDLMERHVATIKSIRQAAGTDDMEQAPAAVEAAFPS